MSDSIRDVETSVRELGALPVPVGPERLTPQERDMILGLIGDAKPATSSLLVSFGESVRDRREHEHPQWEDFYCLNLSSYMGERTGPVLRRLVDIEAENEQLRARVAELEAKREATSARIAELEAAQGTVFRAAHDVIVMGLYATAAEARKHCETVLRREHAETTKVELWWREDEDTVDQPEDGEQELFAHITPRGFDRGRVWNTGYVVTPLEVASEYDEEADE